MLATANNISQQKNFVNKNWKASNFPEIIKEVNNIRNDNLRL